MYCSNCGNPRPDDALICPTCNTAIRRPALQSGAAVRIPNYLVQSIAVTLCCCLPFGIVAIINSAQVDTRLAAGDIAGAQKASQNAKMWGWISFSIGIAFTLISVIGSILSNVHS